MKEYDVSFNKTRFKSKPSGNEIGKISNQLYTRRMDYKELAQEVGECGCTFSPAVYNGKRKKENYIGQQLIALDFDSGISFSEIKNKADKYRLPILFAYKTFSYSDIHEKFRVVFALTDMITDSFTCEASTAMFMKIFEACDEVCKDSSRMFFGGKGLLELADKPVEISGQDMLIAFVTYMNDRYGDTHYIREIEKFYQKYNIKHKKRLPVIKDGGLCYERTINELPVSTVKNKGRRVVTRNFAWSVLYEKCRLYRDFADGNEYYYYPQLFHIASNLINIEKGKNEFLRILQSDKNAECEAYFNRNWKNILNILIEMDYQPQGCINCPYEKECLHGKNMILTAKPGRTTILQTERKQYVSIEEAEESLRENFKKAVYSDKEGVHVIRAQTGIGKTNLYLDNLNNLPYETEQGKVERIFLIAVPTHKLKMEIYYKALSKGIKNIAYTPEMPQFTPEIQNKINHIYSVGAGKYAIKKMIDICETLPGNHPDYKALSNFLDEIQSIKYYTGHIITTHDRLLLSTPKSKILKGREVIIDEDIMRTMLSTNTVNNKDILSVLESGILSKTIENKLRSVIASVNKYQYYSFRENETIKITDELIKVLDNVESNILDLANS